MLQLNDMVFGGKTCLTDISDPRVAAIGQRPQLVLKQGCPSTILVIQQTLGCAPSETKDPVLRGTILRPFAPSDSHGIHLEQSRPLNPFRIILGVESHFKVRWQCTIKA